MISVTLTHEQTLFTTSAMILESCWTQHSPKAGSVMWWFFILLNATQP